MRAVQSFIRATFVDNWFTLRRSSNVLRVALSANIAVVQLFDFQVMISKSIDLKTTSHVIQNSNVFTIKL